MAFSGAASSPAASRRVASRLTSNPESPRGAGVSRQPIRQSRALSESPNPTFGVPVKPPPNAATPYHPDEAAMIEALAACLDGHIDRLTNDGRIGYREWLEGASVFMRRAGEAADGMR